MITLYQFATSPFTEKVRRALNYKGLAFEVHEVARAKVAEGAYADVSTTGKFPALKDGETVVQDSTDILEYLDRAYPDKPVRPTDPGDAALAHVFEEWADESLYFYEMTARLSWEHNLETCLDGFMASMPGMPRDQLKKAILDGVGQLTAAQGVGRKPRETVVADIQRHFKSLDQILQNKEWLVGDRLSSADLAVVCQINALLDAQEARSALEETSKVKDWMARIDDTAPQNRETVQ